MSLLTADRKEVTAPESPKRRATLAEVDPRIPVRLLTGSPGCGKTTVIRRIMTDSGGCRRAYVISDPAALEKFPTTVRGLDDRTAILENGSVCILMHDGDVTAALNFLHLRKLGLIEDRSDRNFDYEEVLVEVPPDCSPLVIVYQLQTDSRLALTFRFNGIAAVIDVVAARQYLGQESPDTQMIARADILILNKRDLLSDGDSEAVLAEVASVNPFALVLMAEQGNVSAARLMAWDPFGVPENGPQGAGLARGGIVQLPPVSIEGRAKRAIRCFVNNPMNSARSNMETARSPVRAVHVRLKGNADIFRISGAVAKVAEQAGENLYRLKCTTSVPSTEHPVVFQYVDGSFVPPAWGSPGDIRETRLTVVGHDFDPRELMADVAACLWDPEAIARGEYTPF